MLGWEFPPFFSGGLGVATYGMVKALSPKVDIKLIVPRASKNISFSNVDIIGLNAISAEEINTENFRMSYANVTAEVHTVPLTISPYHYINEEILKNQWSETDEEIQVKQTKLKTIHTMFSSTDVYGFDIKHKIQVYA